MSAHRLLPLLCLAALLVAASAQGDPPGVYAFVGGTVHPVSGPDLSPGVVIVRRGLIEAIGAGIAAPPDAQVIDVSGMHVYPGLVDAQTSLGMPAVPKAAPRRRGGGPPAGAPGEPVREPAPSTLARQLFKVSEDDLADWHAAGVTTVLVAPTNGIFNGQTALMNLRGDKADAMIVRSPASQQISFAPRSPSTFPDSLMGVMAYLRQSFLDAQQHGEATAIYAKSPAGKQRPETNADLDALLPSVRRELPVVFVADSESMIRRALALAKELNLRAVISGGRQSYKLAQVLKDAGIPLLVSVDFPKPPTSAEAKEDEPLRLMRDRQLAPTSPAALAKAGVAFALVSATAKPDAYLDGVRKAVENGLGESDAIRALTLAPAQILGVDRQVGSLDKGKIANLVVTDKPILDKEMKVKRLFVDGREILLPKEKEKRRDRKEAAAPAPSEAEEVDLQGGTR